MCINDSVKNFAAEGPVPRCLNTEVMRLVFVGFAYQNITIFAANVNQHPNPDDQENAKGKLEASDFRGLQITS